MARGKRPVSFRTRKLSLSAPMVLPWRRGGRVGRRRTTITEGPAASVLGALRRSITAVTAPTARPFVHTSPRWTTAGVWVRGTLAGDSRAVGCEGRAASGLASVIRRRRRSDPLCTRHRTRPGRTPSGCRCPAEGRQPPRRVTCAVLSGPRPRSRRALGCGDRHERLRRPRPPRRAARG